MGVGRPLSSRSGKTKGFDESSRLAPARSPVSPEQHADQRNGQIDPSASTCPWSRPRCKARVVVILKMSHIQFWPFLGRPLEDFRVLPHPIFSSILGHPIFSAVRSTFLAKIRPKILIFYPTQNFDHFWAALLKDVRFYSTRNFGHFWAPSLVTLLIFTKCH